MSARAESEGIVLRRSRSDRVAASGGAAFALLYAAGFVLHGLASGGDEESRAEVVARYADGGNELRMHVGGLLIGFSVVFLLPFLGRLRAALRESEGPRAVFSTAAVGGGLLLAALAAVSAAVGIAAFSSSDFYDAYRVDPDVVLLMQTLSFAALGYALVGGAILVGATSVVGLRTGFLPRWLAVAGLVLAVVLAFGEWALFVPLPLLLLLLWLLIVSVVLEARERRAGRPGREPVVRHSGQAA